MIPGRLGIVVNAWPTAGGLPSGTGRQASLLAHELAVRGAAVDVLVLENGSDARDHESEEDGVRVRRVVRVRPSYRSAHRNVSMARALERWLSDRRPDLVHVVHPGDIGTAGPALVAAAGVPVVSSVCDGLYGCAMGHLANPLIRRPLCVLPVAVDDCAACMATGTNLGAGRFAGVQRERRAFAAASATSGPFVADSAFIGAAVARTIGGDHRTIALPVQVGPAPVAAPSGPLRMGWFGVPLWRKGLDILLDAVAGLDAVEVHLHGPRDSAAEPDYAARVRALADGLPNVVWHPPYAPDEVAARMATVDLVAVPSRAESLPGVAKEALAAGRPVLAGAVAGLPEVVIEGRTGWLVETDEPVAWRRKIEQLDPSTVRALRPHEARPVSAYVTELAAIYSEALTAWPDRRREAPWLPGFAEAERVRGGDPYVRADELFQEAVADLEDGRRIRAVVGLARSSRRVAFDRVLAMPAWWAGVLRGHAWASIKAEAIARETSAARDRPAMVRGIVRGLSGRRSPQP